MIPKPDPREANLPKWAQRQLSTLRRELDTALARAQVARTSLGPADTDTLLDPYDDVPLLLPKGENVRFVLDADSDSWMDVRVTRRGGRPAHLHVMGSAPLAVFPEVTNVLSIGTRSL